MKKLIFSVIWILGLSFASEKNNSQDAYYAKMDVKNNVQISAYHKKENDKNPLRKRWHKRRRKVRNPAQGK